MISVELCSNRSLDLEELNYLSPTFCSIVWHIKSEITKENVSHIDSLLFAKRLKNLVDNIVLHLPGRYLSKYQLFLVLKVLQDVKINNLLVLQGEFSPTLYEKQDFKYASSLVKFIRQSYDTAFTIGVTATPKKYVSFKEENDAFLFLKYKINAGADYVITQINFDLQNLKNLCNKCLKQKVNVSVVVGIVIISSLNNVKTLARFCEIPSHISKILETNKQNSEAICNYGVYQCVEYVKQIFTLQGSNVIGIHFYSFNNIKLVNNVCRALGIRGQHIERPLKDMLLYNVVRSLIIDRITIN